MDLTTPDEWQNLHHANTHGADHVKAISTITSMLSKIVSPCEAARATTTIYNQALVNSSTDGVNSSANKVSAFWALYFCDAIRLSGAPDSQHKLLELLNEISRQPNVRTAAGTLVCLRESSGELKGYWKDLPGWIFALREYGLFWADPSDFAPDAMDDYYARGRPTLNATRFAAMMFQGGIFVSDLHAEAPFTIVRGLEMTYDEERGNWRDEMRTLVPIVAEWFLGAGEVIYRNCLGNCVDDGEVVGIIENEWGWFIRRWRLWKEQFRGLEDGEDVGGECREYAARARRAMEEIEMEGNVIASTCDSLEHALLVRTIFRYWTVEQEQCARSLHIYGYERLPYEILLTAS